MGCIPDRWRLTILVISLIVARAIDTVLYYRLANILDGFGLYFSSIILPIGFLLVLWPIVIYRIYTGELTASLWGLQPAPAR
jgi:hypothetical protein